MSHNHHIALIILFSIGALIGCSKSTPKRHNIAGNISWNGQPVKAGYITFNPDGKKGNNGSQGFAVIKNGKFDTRSEGGVGVAPGAQIMEVRGFDGVSTSKDDTLGKRLFSSYKKSETFDRETLEYNLDIPKADVIFPAR